MNFHDISISRSYYPYHTTSIILQAMPPVRTRDQDTKQRRLGDLPTWSQVYRKFPRIDAYETQNWSWRFWSYVNEPEVSNHHDINRRA